MHVIAVDAMGGDHAPESTVQGAMRAAQEFSDIKIELVGQKDAISKAMRGARYPSITIVDAPDIITCDESPVMALRKKPNSSLVVSFQTVREGRANAVVSAGSTGAVTAGSMFKLDRIKGIERPAIAVVVPTPKDPVIMLDAGANVDCTPDMLSQFAIMGAIYCSVLRGIQRPRVGLVNIGEEAEKGNQLTKAAHRLLSAGHPSYEFVGNVEPRGIPMGDVDVAVCDGFIGNVIMKTMEGLSKSMFDMIRREIESSVMTKLGGALVMPAMKRLKTLMSAEEVGGALMLGSSGLVVKAHGNSSAFAFYSAIRQTRALLAADVVSKIQAALLV